MGTYDRQVATAQRLIAAKGALLKWYQPNAGVPDDPSRPWLGKDALPTAYDVSLCFVPEGIAKSYMVGTGLERSEVPIGGLFALMGETAFIPTLKDWIALPATPSIVFATLDTPIVDLAPALDQNILWILRFTQ